ncbi:4-hydroxy-tetrahydrodipicolinate reductase [Negadavirga shengliensis]|uniref:4-hydroxy-tetrahydrodipicolinate reductase n=1 Tax=Negadavirga shengliensis TaxID=1389218 RepID=A0ABV9T5H5_9BACT
MNILILGYGKMGRIISQIAEERGHKIAARINIENVSDLETLDTAKVDVAIEFSQPEAAYDNIRWCLQNNIPVVSGTTGWLEKKPEIEKLCEAQKGAFFYASNFSIGVNIFFKVNRFLARLMNDQRDYQVSMEEVHHTEKKDAPSGTAITLAEGIIEEMEKVKTWKLVKEEKVEDQELPVVAKRIDPAPGTHIVTYHSKIDDIEIKHTAHSREGFALGAVLVAEWIKDKKGVLDMNDFLTF